MWRRLGLAFFAAAVAVAGAVSATACEYDNIPGYNHATGQIDADPYAGAYADVADKVAIDQRDAAIERARTSFVQRFGLIEAAEAATAAKPQLVAASVPDARPN